MGFHTLIFTIPNRGGGPYTDDNARALILTVMLERLFWIKMTAEKASSMVTNFSARY